jgi:hypothetical protein
MFRGDIYYFKYVYSRLLQNKAATDILFYCQSDWGGWGGVRKLSPEVLHESYRKSYITESDTKLQYG